MILKFKPIAKSGTSLGRVLEYIAKDKGRIENYLEQSLFHNVSGIELEDIQQEFQENFDQYASGRYKNVGMHLIASVSPLDREVITPEMMDDILSTYLSHTFPNSKAFGTHHISQDHFHTHIVVSSNQIASEKSSRLSKAKLRESHEQILSYIQQTFPQLTIAFDMKDYGKKLNNEREYYLKKRNPTLKLSREELTTHVQSLFRQSASSQAFYDNLSQAGFETYDYHNETFGIRFGEDNKKMRFSRLGISPEHIQALDVQHELISERMNDLEVIKQQSNERSLLRTREQ